VASARTPADLETPPIDLVALRILADGDEAFERELMQTFVASGNNTLREIQQALTSNDCKRVQRAAHSAKGAGASMHAAGIKAAAGRLETAAESGANQSLAGLADELGQEVARVIEHLRVNQR
jgi:HPt (histidine-containing phosphotransfer) domain-containing protein